MDEELYAFGASDFERVAAAVKKVEGGSGAGLPRSAASNRNYSRIAFKNSNAGTAPKHGVLRVTGTTIVDNFPFLTIDQPDSTYRWLYLVNGSDDVVANGYGWGTWLWHGGQVLYGTGTPALGEMWGPTASAWTLQKDAPGFYILGGNDTTLTTTIAVQLIREILVKNVTGSAIAAAGSGTATLYGSTALSEATLGLTLTVNNRSSTSWADTKYGTADLINGKNYVSPQQT